jgi:superfamily II DNA/RNA helicase
MEGPTPSNHPRLDTDTNWGKYDTHEGRQLCKKILAKYVVYEPHDYILDGICPVMDGFDLLATTPTGSGKTGYLILLMLVIREIAADKTLAIAKEIFPKDPVMIVVCPTKALEDDIVSIIIVNDRIQLT